MDMDQSVSNTPGQRFRFELVISGKSGRPIFFVLR